MLYQCTYRSLAQQDSNISLHADETILEALTKHGVYTKKACINGACGICLMKLITGDIDYHGRTPRGLNSQEIADDYILPCIAKCRSDLTLLARPTTKSKNSAKK
ncbi:2Fe-2S iron-sulfur cluster-binding protein [Marinomonas sp. 15G1-11]|uniref:2Fe-2S iron-sulfur cluster-binding protein n=1 Tax=Marinomonas phaeophyticola TaxID=3004091 RepID=A0ABT4JW07_9GAMM|nr:2Fe-2S iron-sulfur cluster-binding protein [Marinomonas sp. 15G1-11]MCZ2721754.1 2Fe-2S iron-sulfur cluster-binding protein [Marinomonas sp. 15G1-11]